MTGQGDIQRILGNFEQAQSFYLESLAGFRAVGDKGGIPWAYQNLAYAYLGQGNVGQARVYLIDAVRVFREMPAPRALLHSLACQAGVLVQEGKLEQALRLAGIVDRLLRQMAIQLDTAEDVAFQQTLTALRTQLDAEAFETIWAEAQAQELSLEQAVQLVFDIG
jgi:tetratricopeptide (TPR) repeat protein